MSLELHASAFAYAGVGGLLLGESGTGKSAALAQALLFGATLIADDHVVLHKVGRGHKGATGTPLLGERSKSPCDVLAKWEESERGFRVRGELGASPSPEIPLFTSGRVERTVIGDFNLSPRRGALAALPVNNTEETHILIASAPSEIAGALELRGLGIINVPAMGSHPIHFAIHLTHEATERLPMPETREFLGIAVPFLMLPAAPQTPVASLLLYMTAMREGRVFPQDWRPIRRA